MHTRLGEFNDPGSEPAPAGEPQALSIGANLMNIVQSRVELGGLGTIHAYTLSGAAGELAHQFPPLRDNDRDVALLVGDGLELSDALSVTQAGEPVRRESLRMRSGRHGEDRASAAAFELSSLGATATLRFAGGTPVTVYVAVLRRSKAALREISKFAQGKIIGPAIQKFRDRCWACKFLMKALTSMAISGLPMPDPEDVLELIGDLLPAELVEWLLHTDIGQLLGRIGAMLRRLIPKDEIARILCEQMGFCAVAMAPGGPVPAPRDVRIYDVRLEGNEAGNAAFIDEVHRLPGVERQSRFIVEPEPGRVRARVFSAQPVDAASFEGIARTKGLTIVEVIQLQ